MNTHPTLDDINRNESYTKYYCANINEKTFNCSNELTYIIEGGFGFNYRYCNSCYRKWNKLNEKEQEASINKTFFKFKTYAFSS